MQREERQLEYDKLWRETLRKGIQSRSRQAREGNPPRPPRKTSFEKKWVRQVASGGYGKVYKLKRKRGQKFDLVFKEQGDWGHAIKEIKLLRKKHKQPNLGFILDSFPAYEKKHWYEGPNLITVMPFMDGGELDKHYHASPEAYTKWMFYILYQFQKTYKNAHCDPHLGNFLVHKVKQEETTVRIGNKRVVLPETPYTLLLFDPLTGAEEYRECPPKFGFPNNYYDYFYLTNLLLNGPDYFSSSRTLSSSRTRTRKSSGARGGWFDWFRQARKTKQKAPKETELGALAKKLDKVRRMTYKKIKTDEFIMGFIPDGRKIKVDKTSPAQVSLECLELLSS